ncbi:chalcone isomerase family protein [Curvibacter sp. APW13]|uniref:chalcone isomerase family protein n=1 Tax=Curvibacter sp. APW13 TaxID=3077236 RepID=UPI0028DEE966|nr:chalcone isomerase family protein [Curvibacter sp. APW13]MDT8989914.1 chalcone isomerase family protein [Curvibacter sp. APW13]
MKIPFVLAPLVLGAAPQAPAQAAEVAGIHFEDAIHLGDTALQLNGTGVRYLAIFKVLAAGLYLSKKSTTAEAAFAAPGPKRMQMTMLVDMDAKKFSREFIKGFTNSVGKTPMSRLIPGLTRMGALIDNRGRFVRGDTITVDWVPGTGAVIAINGVAQGDPFREQEFFDTLLSNWIGPTPADWKLKDGLLGQSS